MEFAAGFELVDPLLDDLEASLEESIFSNYYLLRHILKHSSFQDLKSHRQVNRLWNLEATKMLRSNFTLRPIRILKSQAYMNDPRRRVNKPSLKLKEFTNLVSNSNTFPCATFSFHCKIKNLQKGKIHDFFHTHGDIVKSFEATFQISSPVELEQCQVFLSEKLPNLEELIVHHFDALLVDFDFSLLCETETVKNLQLKKLETIIFYRNVFKPVLSAFLRMSKNLEKIFWTLDDGCNHRKSLSALVDLNAIPLLKSLQLIIRDENVDLYEVVVKQEPRLEKLEAIQFESGLSLEYFPRMVQILTSLIQFGKKTLRCFGDIQYFGRISGLRIPIIVNGTELELCFASFGHLR